MAKKAISAVSYIRVSGKGQIGGHGFTRQRQAISGYAKAHRLTLLEEYKDGGERGDTGARPALAALLDRLKSNGVKLVLVERADRLARDLMVGEVILGQFRDLGVKVIAAEGDGTDLTVADGDPTRKLVRQVLAAIAEFDKSITVAKLRAARERKRRQNGKCEGRKRFGERPGEQRVIDRIKQLRRKPRGAKPLSYAVIAKRLNDEQIPTRTGGLWVPSTVYGIVNGQRR